MYDSKTIDAVIDYQLQYDEYGNIVYEKTFNAWGEPYINSYKYEYR